MREFISRPVYYFNISMVDPIGPLFLGPEGCYLGLCDFV